MSRPSQVAQTSDVVLEPAAEATASQELTRRVVFECNATGAELASGVIVNVANARDVFKPKLDAAATPEEKTAYEEKDFSQGIITSMTLKAVSSSCPETVTFGMNLFAKEPNVVNSKGWLYAKECNEMSSNHAHENEGYTNVVTILPHERQRPNEVVYEPSNVMDNRLVQEYGGYNLEKLHEGIVNFKGKDYSYVPQGHIVTTIVRNNWEQLGVNLDSETAREGEYLKISSSVVNECIDQLYNSVILEIPYTQLSEMGARFQAATEGDATYKVVAEMQVSYRYP